MIDEVTKARLAIGLPSCGVSTKPRVAAVTAGGPFARPFLMNEVATVDAEIDRYCFTVRAR
jgi:hypothetical protein